MAYKGSRSKKRGSRRWLVVILLLVGVVAGVMYRANGLFGPWSGDLSAIERDPPVVTWSALPKGIPADRTELILGVADSGSGLGRVFAHVEQGELKAQLIDMPFDGSTTKESHIKIPIEARKIGLKEGDATITAVVSDGAVWKNSTTLTANVRVNYTRSRVEVLTTQQNGSVGGTELLFFRVVGHGFEKGGVEVQSKIYDSHPIAAFDPSLGSVERVFGSLFPIPYDFNPDTGKLRLVVTDEFGSVLTAPFNYRIAKKKFPVVDMKLGDSFMNRKVPELLEYLKARDPSIASSGDNYKDFKLVNEILRKLVEAEVQEVLRAGAVKERLWSGVFIRPLPAAPKATFAEKRHYKHGTTMLSESLHMGIDLADVAQAAVHAANRGKVLFVGELGIYGEAVIIDHGTGVSSLYGHLSAISVNVGDIVDTGHEIGRTGSTGLAGGDHLHFEIRVQGVPVSPFEWWDPLWIKEHVEEKLKGLAPVAVPEVTPTAQAKG